MIVHGMLSMWVVMICLWAGTESTLTDPPTALCNNTACQTALPGCGVYRSVGEGNFGARRFYCESCSNTTVPLKSGVVAQFFQLAAGLPKSPLTVCTDKLSVTEIFKEGELPNCLYYYNQTNLSALVVTFYCAECAKGFSPAQYGVNLTLQEFSTKINASLITQTVCEVKKHSRIIATPALLFIAVLIVQVLLR